MSKQPKIAHSVLSFASNLNPRLASQPQQYRTKYIYDGWRVIQERDMNNTPTVSYTRGNDLSGSMEGAGGIGGLLARSSGYSGGNWTTHNFYFADGNGNITYMLNSSQAMVASYRYDPFGNTISSSGTLASANVYRFSSKEIHVNSGMYYYLFRFYDPNLQRWINRDPVEERGGINLYGFVLNKVTGTVDLWGRMGVPRIPPAALWLWLLFPPQEPPPTPNPVSPPPLPLSGLAAFCAVMAPVSCGDPVLTDKGWMCPGGKILTFPRCRPPNVIWCNYTCPDDSPERRMFEPPCPGIIWTAKGPCVLDTPFQSKN